MVKIVGINKRFDAVVALDNASIHVKTGEIKALLGANGSGKSTMVKVLSGLVNPDSGEIFIKGKPAIIKSSIDARNLKIAVAYQDLSLIPEMSVADNIVLGLEKKNKLGIINKKKSSELAIHYINKLKINCEPTTLVQSLMPSTQSMIEIAKAMAMEPDVLILDEATASLHADEVDTLFEVLAELKEKGVSIITVTHRMEEIYRICDSCTILRGGKTVAEGSIQQMDLDTVVYHMTGKKPETTQVRLEQTANNHDQEVLLEVKDINIFPKVKGVDFKIHRGEIVGIGGLDGQGQSEFLRAILADVKRSSGEITYRGKKVDFKTPADAIKQDMGFISGDRNTESIFPIRTVAENIFVGAATKGGLFSYLSSKEVKNFASDAVTKYDIKTGSLDHPASSLSGGNQQKLVVARWIALAPDLLLLDDPTKGVDISARREIHKILEQCVKDGMSVIYISSDNAELLEISERIYVFYEGKVSDELFGENKTEERLIAAMFKLNK